MPDTEILIKWLSVISAVITGVFLLGYLFYTIFTSSGSLGSSGSSGSSGSKSYQRSLSLDKLYDEAAGNDPLSDARLTAKIDISSETQSCGFLVTYTGVKERQVECTTGCNDDATDEHSNFCKQFIYPGTDPLKDTFLDETFIRRRDASR